MKGIILVHSITFENVPVCEIDVLVKKEHLKEYIFLKEVLAERKCPYAYRRISDDLVYLGSQDFLHTPPFTAKIVEALTKLDGFKVEVVEP